MSPFKLVFLVAGLLIVSPAFGACPDFPVPLNYPTSATHSRYVVMADFNADGFRDLAVTGFDKISIMMGNGDGTFDAAVTYATGVNANSAGLAMGDFNGDTKPDLAVANTDLANVAVFIGVGDGTFGSATTFTTGSGSFPNSITAADVDGDTKADLVVTKGTTHSVAVLIGNGSGSFAAPASYGVGLNPASVVIGHLNGDSLVDMVTANRSGPFGAGNVSVLFGSGGGEFFGSSLNYATALAATSVVIGNFNGDSAGDLAVGNGSNISVFLNNGNGTFPAPVNYLVPFTKSVALGDFNGDTKIDLVATGEEANNVSILLGDGTGAFAVSRFSAGQKPASVASGDVNGDGLIDLAVVNDGTTTLAKNTVTILAGTGQGTFDSPRGFVTGFTPQSLAVGDYNGDGIRDLATANASNADNVSILLGTAGGVFAEAVNYPAGDPSTIAGGDFNGDGIGDLATANTSTDNISVLMGNGNGTFAAALTTGIVGDAPGPIKTGDFNGDGKADLAVTAQIDDKVVVLISNGNGTFATGVPYTAGPQPGALAVATLNGDARSDVVVANGNSPFTVSVLLSNADGTLAAPVSYGVANHPSDIAIADFNSDGANDLAVAAEDTVSVLLGVGNGTFGAAVGYAAMTAGSIAVSDFNGDGKLDLALVSSLANTVILFGAGNGTFGAPTAPFNAGWQPGDVVAGDFNRDGTNDLILGNGTGALDVTLIANRSTCASLGSILPSSGSIAGGQSTVISGTNISGAVSVTFGGIAGTITGNTPTSITVTTPAHAAGAVDVVVATAGGAATLPGGYTFIAPPAAPTGLVAAGVSALQVNLVWNAVSGATSYQIDRKGAGGDYAQIGTSGTASFSDAAASSATAYLYRVRAVNIGGTSPNSLPDVATTIVFSDNPLTAGTTVKAAHLAELRSAVNAIRALAGQSAASFTDAATAGILVKAVHISELRTALDAARTALSLSAGGYSDSSLTGIAVCALHVQELRSRM